MSAGTGWNPEALKSGAKVLWRADVGAGFSNVAVRDGRLSTMGTGRVYGPSKDGTIFCLDASDGSVV